MKKEISQYLYGYILTNQEVSTGENILHTLTPLSGTTLGSNGLCFGYRPSTESPHYIGATNYSMTGIIPATVDDAPFNFYVKGITSWGSATGERLALFCKNNTIAYARKLAEGTSEGLFSVTQLDTDYFQFTVNKAYFDAVTWSDVTGIVVSFANTTEGQNIIVSLTPIENTIVTWYQWASTEHAFIPADYEKEILALENRTTSLENRVDELSAGTDGTFTYVAEEAKRVAEVVQGNRTVGSLTFTANWFR